LDFGAEALQKEQLGRERRRLENKLRYNYSSGQLSTAAMKTDGGEAMGP
jgi:hypothetical protein